MPKVRSSHGRAAIGRSIVQRRRPSVAPVASIRPCLASDHCGLPIVDGAPVALCGRHLREVYEFAQDMIEVYEFAQDMISEKWDAVMRTYVADLQSRFSPPAPVKRGIRHGHIYFIRFGDRVKIGYSTDPASRIRVLPHEEVIGVIRGTRADERAWHDLLADFHVVGEWFTATPEVLASLAQVVENAG
jgi:hypothetical protein